MKPTMPCSTGLHSTFLPALGWFLGARLGALEGMGELEEMPALRN